MFCTIQNDFKWFLSGYEKFVYCIKLWPRARFASASVKWQSGRIRNWNDVFGRNDSTSRGEAEFSMTNTNVCEMSHCVTHTSLTKWNLSKGWGCSLSFRSPLQQWILGLFLTSALILFSDWISSFWILTNIDCDTHWNIAPEVVPLQNNLN